MSEKCDNVQGVSKPITFCRKLKLTWNLNGPYTIQLVVRQVVQLETIEYKTKYRALYLQVWLLAR